MSIQKIIYHQLIPADYCEYRRVWLDCLVQYPNNFGATYEEGLDLKSLKLANAILNADEYNFAIGAFTGDRLIGMCGFVTDMRLKARHRGEIVQLFVDSEYNGLGIGKKLLQLVIDKAFSNGKTEQVILSVVSTNDSVIKLYKHFGFAEYGRLENFFKSGAEYFSQSFFYLVKPEGVKHEINFRNRKTNIVQ
jgi:ribosomal protein S18 acetylase RimI-like enzyme